MSWQETRAAVVKAEVSAREEPVVLLHKEHLRSPCQQQRQAFLCHQVIPEHLLLHLRQPLQRKLLLPPQPGNPETIRTYYNNFLTLLKNCWSYYKRYLGEGRQQTIWRSRPASGRGEGKQFLSLKKPRFFKTNKPTF